MRTAVVLLTRDLRLRDNPALSGAVGAADRVVPLFVLDPTLLAISPNRHRFLIQSLADLRQTLRDRGGELVLRRGDPVTQALRVARQVGADGLAVAADVSRYARRRERRLAAGCDRAGISLRMFPGSTLVAPGSLRPAGGGRAYQVFTPYWRAWQQVAWREPVPTPRSFSMSTVDAGVLPVPPVRGVSPDAAVGGETAARQALDRWLSEVDGYPANHDLMAADKTSRLSPYLRFGCLSIVELAAKAHRAEEFIRQLCWRDFYYQVALAFPKLTTTPVRAVTENWHEDPAALTAWQEGRTGVPIVDAGMRQLKAEGWLHNRARLIVGDYLTKHLGLDWRAGAAWFERWLLDGDVPNNYGNWQWVAGTGNDTRPYRRFNPNRQAHRFDPDGDYVRRYVAELADIPGGAVHEAGIHSG